MEANDQPRTSSSLSRSPRTPWLPMLATALLLATAGNSHARKVAPATAEDVMARLLQDRGLAPSATHGLSFDDYIESSGVEDGTTRVWVTLGPDGNIIPGGEWRDGHPEYCAQRARHTQTAARLIRFKIHRTSETLDGRTRYQYYVFAGAVDGATGTVTNQREWDSSVMQDASAMANPDAEALYPLMNEALDDMGVHPGEMVGPCGDVRLEHVSGSQVQEPIVFQAGFQGSSGRYLEYTWDFGDGSPPEDIGQRANHVYDRSGTYPVTVRVEGEDIEPGSRTIEVVIGGELALHFSSRIQMIAPENTRIVSKFESVVPLTMSADGTLQGSAPIRNVEFSHSAADMLRARLGCTVTTRDGVLDVRATLPDEADGTAGGPRVALSMLQDRAIPLMKAVPGADIHCPGAQGGGLVAMMRKVISGIGMAWWSGFIALHQDAARMEGSFHFNDWDTAGASGVIARKTYRGSLTYEGPTTVSEVTTIEIRR